MASASIVQAPEETPSRALFGHPPGLTVLFLTQMWAEFSYFGLQALLVYYMTERLGFSQARASLIYGAYGGAAFFSPFLGGIVADRWLGRRRSVITGGVLMMCGHFAMAVPALLLPALALVALGNGLFIPPLAVQVGNLYAPGDARRAHAFSAYYMGINLGGLLAPLVCGSLGEYVGYHWGFAAAGFGMLLGLATYRMGGALLPAEPVLPRAVRGAAPATPRTGEEAGRLRLLASIVAAVILFRIAYEQSGNVIALWVLHQTDRTLFGGALTIPATWFQAINPLLIIALTPVMLAWWDWRERAGRPPRLLLRMSAGCVIAGVSMLVMVAAAARYASYAQPVSALWVTGYFVLLTIGELMVIPVGLTLVSALAPARMAAMAMGAWYIAKFLGSVAAGIMGSYWQQLPPTLFFALGAASVLLGAGVLFLLERGQTAPASSC